MSQKSISNLIKDEFAKAIHEDVLFKGISEELAIFVKSKKTNKADLINSLKNSCYANLI